MFGSIASENTFCNWQGFLYAILYMSVKQKMSTIVLKEGTTTTIFVQK